MPGEQIPRGAAPGAAQSPEPPGRWLPALLALPNVPVVAAWGSSLVSEWLWHALGMRAAFSLTLCLGGPASLAGLAAGLVGVRAGRPADRRWWWGCVAANAAGLFANCAGFAGYLAARRG